MTVISREVSRVRNTPDGSEEVDVETIKYDTGLATQQVVGLYRSVNGVMESMPLPPQHVTETWET